MLLQSLLKGKRKKLKVFVLLFTTVLTIGFLLPEPRVIPVVGASSNDWHKDSFWYEPWGSSGTHKGIDIFGAMQTDVVSTTHGWVLYAGALKKGGKVILVLGPRWRLHYFAHLHSIDTSLFSLVSAGEKIGTLGDSGNAKGKPPHLHYSILRILPAPWKIDNATQGYKKAFFINPQVYLNQNK